MTSHVKVIKPCNGIEVQKVTPLIKIIDGPSVKLSPLDLAPNDYISQLEEPKSDSKFGTKDMKMQLEKLQISARELSSKQTEQLSKNSKKKQTTKINIASEDSSSMDFDGFDVRVSFDKDPINEVCKQNDTINENKKTILHKMYDYNGNNKTVFSNNFFNNIKPLMKSWKRNRPKVNKVQTKDVGT